MENKFRKGLILGGILAVGASVGFILSKEGEKFSEELQKDLKTLSKKLKKRLHALEDLTKENFMELVDTVVEDFAKEKNIAEHLKNELIASLDATWKEMEAEYLAEQEDLMAKK